MLNSHDPVDLLVLRRDGHPVLLRRAISLSFDFYGGWRNMKLLDSGECRRVRDVCILQINGLEVFL